MPGLEGCEHSLSPMESMSPLPLQVLKDYLGLEKVIWLWRGMEGDTEVVNGAHARQIRHLLPHRLSAGPHGTPCLPKHASWRA